MRVVILKEFVKDNFPAHPLLDFALEVEKITTSKVCNPYNKGLSLMILICNTMHKSL